MDWVSASAKAVVKLLFEGNKGQVVNDNKMFIYIYYKIKCVESDTDKGGE